MAVYRSFARGPDTTAHDQTASHSAGSTSASPSMLCGFLTSRAGTGLGRHRLAVKKLAMPPCWHYSSPSGKVDLVAGRMEPRLKSACDLFRRILQAAFPDDCDAPALCAQRGPHRSVSRDIARELLAPEGRIALGYRREQATAMAVPEASVHEHRRPVPGEQEIRRTRQTPGVQPVTETAGKERRPKL